VTYSNLLCVSDTDIDLLYLSHAELCPIPLIRTERERMEYPAPLAKSIDELGFIYHTGLPLEPPLNSCFRSLVVFSMFSGTRTYRCSLRFFCQIALLSVVFSLCSCGGGPSSSASGSSSGGGGGTTGGGGGGGTTGNGSFTAGRTKYVRTDATTEYFTWINSHWIIYNTPTNDFFVTDPSSNHVMVIDAATETEVAVISVPGAFSIDDTPDHKTLYVGTLIGDLYAIDPVSRTVTKRYIASQIGPTGYFASSAVVLADGRLALLGAPGGIPSVDGSANFAIWNPADNTLLLDGQSGSVSGYPCGSSMGNIGGFSRTVDRTKVILASIDSDATLCEIDEATGQSIHVSTGASFTMVNFRTTPDGKYIIVPGNPGGANVYDAETLAPVMQFPVDGDTSTDSGFFLSADSKTLFTPNSTIDYAYDLASQQQTGWLPNLDVQPTNGGGAEGPISAPNLQATDGTGLFAGPLEQGVGFLDTAVLRSGAVGTQFMNGYLTPATGPTSGGTQIQLPDPNPVGALSAMFFGSEHATQLSGGSGTILATTPAGNSGPADVYTFTTDGGFQVLPEGFSYGPTILQVSPDMSTAEGGGTGYIFGYGFGPFTTNTAVPSSLQVSIGSKQAQLTALYSIGVGAPPFQLQAIAYTIPPGAVGTADATVTSSSGSATAHAALTYLSGIQQFPLPSASLVQGIYDPYRDVYYFTDANKIQIFSRTLGNWLSPISIPAPQGANQRLWGIALSPDGTKLAVADISAGVIYELNPVNPASITTFPVSTTSTFGTTVMPVGVAISDSGMIYYATWAPDVSGASGFFKLNTNTGAITNYHIDSPGEYSSGYPLDTFLRTEISSDNSRVFFNADGYVFSIDTATDNIISASNDVGCCYGDYDLTLSANQKQFEASSYLYDSNLNAESYYSLNDREIQTTGYIYGAKLSFDGNMLFQPSIAGLDVLDGRLGNLLHRISLPVALSQNYDALVADGNDNVLVAITGANGTGIAVVDLSSVPAPPPLPFAGTSPVRAKRLVPWQALRFGPRETQGLQIGRKHLSVVPRQVPHRTNQVFMPAK
jgi:YVTN family beta-propeller protein